MVERLRTLNKKSIHEQKTTMLIQEEKEFLRKTQ